MERAELKEILDKIEEEFMTDGIEIDKYNLTEELCNRIGENDSERECYEDILNNYKGSIQTYNSHVEYYEIRDLISEKLDEIEERGLEEKLSRRKLGLDFLKAELEQLSELRGNDEKIEKIIKDVEKLQADFREINL